MLVIQLLGDSVAWSAVRGIVELWGVLFFFFKIFKIGGGGGRKKYLILLYFFS